MRIMIFANDDGGLWNFRRELLEQVANEHDVYFCVPRGDYVNKIEKLGCKFIPCDLVERHGINPIKEMRLRSLL